VHDGPLIQRDDGFGCLYPRTPGRRQRLLTEIFNWQHLPRVGLLQRCALAVEKLLNIPRRW
jgi:hypothetical protein